MMNLDKPALESSDIQGFILSGYGHLKYSGYVFIHIDDATKAKLWLRQLLSHSLITSANWEVDGKIVKPDRALNIAFTYNGLRALGLQEESLKSFSQEFQQGMAYQERARRLGDINRNDPAGWEIGGPASSDDSSGKAPADKIHAVLIFEESTEAGLGAMIAEQLKPGEEHGVHQVGTVQTGWLSDDGREHFGFADAISEPNIEGSPKPVQDGQSFIRPGEFILGYLNEYDRLPTTPTVPAKADVGNHLPGLQHVSPGSDTGALKDFGRNGSYLVFRKLQQNVAVFRQYFVENFETEEERALMAAKLIGRWPSGTPLVVDPDKDPNVNNLIKGRKNDFYYSDDAEGLRCPLGAHIRRVNPRDSFGDDPKESIRSVNRHRILRRGALFGEKLPPGKLQDDGVRRGVLFFAVNSDIKRQFEFIQQTWINNPKFHGLYDDKDPLLGNHDDGAGHMTVQERPVRRRLNNLNGFVTVTGGAYFFMPSLSALRFLARMEG